MLDSNKLAEGHNYFSLRGPVVSSEQNIIAYGVDTIGRRFYTVRFKNLATGQVVAAVEAMKAKHDVKAPCAGKVVSIDAELGADVVAGQPIMTIGG